MTVWFWDFGDGATSTEKDPIHTYSAYGSYPVELTATDPGDPVESIPRYSDTEIQTIRLEPELKASFEPFAVGNYTVRFTDTSTGGPTAWRWDFDDGSVSTELNPSHVFRQAGSFNVSLTVTNSGRTSTAWKTVVVERTPTPSPVPPPPSPVPPISPPTLILYPMSMSPLTVTVDGTAAPGTAGTEITRISWDWGDGTAVEDHDVPNTHIYPASGSYTVTVTAYQSDGQSTTKPLTIRVNGPTGTTIAPPTTTTPSATPTATATTVPPSVTATTVNVTLTTTGDPPPPGFPWWLVAIVAVGLLAGGVVAVKAITKPGPSDEARVPGLTVEARGGLRRPRTEEPPRREARMEIEVRGGIRHER